MSILSQNSLSIFKVMLDLIENGSTEEDLDKLKRLWTLTGLDVDGCEWIFSEYSHHIKYIFTPTKHVMLESLPSWGGMELTNPSVFAITREEEVEASQRILVLLSSTNKFTIDTSFVRSRHYLLKLK